ncbi:PAS domain-containing protein [Dongia sp.]|uniref:PAS domain-containing protein n=1 Tax=Dongia sp. TaxID=1977262 RepID=UPI0035B2DD92
MHEYVSALEQAAELPTLKRIIALWEKKRAGRPAPLRADFDPAEMVYALGDLSLFDVEDNPRRYWCRLDGTRQVELFGIDCTNKYLDECFPPDYYALAYKSFTEVMETGRPSLYQRQIPYAGRLIRYEVALLPLSRDGTRLDMLLVALTPHWE